MKASLAKVVNRTAIAAQIAAGVALSIPGRAIAACDPNAGLNGGTDCITPPTDVTLPQAIEIIVNTLLFVIGVVAVIMLIVGGLRYVLSGGDPKNTAAAKDTILYAIIGIVVALLAYAIVSFVIGQF